LHKEEDGTVYDKINEIAEIDADEAETKVKNIKQKNLSANGGSRLHNISSIRPQKGSGMTSFLNQCLIVDVYVCFPLNYAKSLLCLLLNPIKAIRQKTALIIK